MHFFNLQDRHSSEIFTLKMPLGNMSISFFVINITQQMANMSTENRVKQLGSVEEDKL